MLGFIVFSYIEWPIEAPSHFVTRRRTERNLLAHVYFLCKYLVALVRVWCSLFSLLFLLFSRLPNTPLKDDNSRDAWLSLFSLKRKEASLVVGHLQVVLMS